MRTPWAEFEKTLEYEEKASLSIMFPEDEHWPMDDYLDEYGDPTTNGHNHVAYTLDGVKGDAGASEQEGTHPEIQDHVNDPPHHDRYE